MRRGRSSGFLGIAVEHYLNLPDEALDPLFVLTAAFFRGVYPSEAQVGDVCPLYKNNDKFRPVMLLEVAYKLVTGEVARRLSILVYRFGLVDECHYGFVRGGNMTWAIKIMNAL